MEIEYPFLNNRYKVLEIINAGGMSTVLKAEDQNLGNSICVIKEMSNYFKSQKERIYAVQKFKEEALILAKMRHPNIPIVIDYFVENDKYYLVMNYIKGKNLKQLVEGHPGKALSEDLVKNIGVQICTILEYLHNQNPPIIHRDLKPSNFVMEEDSGNVILIDFGIARKYEPEKTGTLIGTPGYMAPEQYTGKIDLRSDIFGLGSTLHHMITGEDPANRESLEFALVTKLRPDISYHMESIISKALEYNPKRRFHTATEMKMALLQRSYLEINRSTPRSPYKPAPIPEVLPKYIELSRKTNLKHQDLVQKSIPSFPMKTGAATAAPSSEGFIYVQLQSFLDKESIREILNTHIGIDIGAMNIKLVQMNIDERYYMYPNKILIIPTPVGAITNGLITNPQQMGSLLKKAFTDFDIKASKALISIPKNRCHFYSLLMKDMPDSKLQEIIPQLSKEHFPFYKQGIIIDYQAIHSYIPGNEGNMELILAGAEKEIVDGLKQTIEETGLELAGIKFQPFLLNQAINLLVSENIKSKCIAIIDIGAENTSINIVKDGCLWHTSLLSSGGNNFTKEIASKLEINLAKAELLKKKKLKLNLPKGATQSEFILFNIINGILKTMLNDILNVIEKFKIKYKIVWSIPLIFTGGTAILKNFDKYVENELRIRCLKFKMPVSKQESANKDIVSEIGPSLMISFGLAMNKIVQREKFQQDFLEEKPQEKKSLWNILTSKFF